MTRPDVYEAFGLARNPFAHPKPNGTATSPLTSGWVDRGFGPAPQPGGRRFVQFVGDKGAGKSTMLASWRRQQPGPHHWVGPGRADRRQPVPVAAIAYWDEVDRLGGRALRSGLASAARQGATIVAGTHRDLSRVAEAAGLDVITHHLGPLGLADLRRWVDAELAAVELPGGAPLGSIRAGLDDVALAEVAAQAGCSWRVAGDLLHARMAWLVAGRAQSRA